MISKEEKLLPVRWQTPYIKCLPVYVWSTRLDGFFIFENRVDSGGEWACYFVRHKYSHRFFLCSITRCEEREHASIV